MMPLRKLAMHQRRGAHHTPAIDLADGLMSEANAEDRYYRASALDQLEADAGAVRIARSGRQHDGLRALGEDLVHTHLVIAVDAGRRPPFAQEVDDIIRKAVVV